MKEYHYEDVLLSLKEIVHAKGERYVYEKAVDGRCVYYDPDTEQPSCLVGHFVYKEGLLSFDDIAPYEDDNAESMTQQLEHDQIAYFDSRSVQLLNIAQELQDQGRPWGEALDYAITKISRRYYE